MSVNSNVLSARDTNAKMGSPEKKSGAGKPEPKSLESHRQDLARIKESKQQYVSPSDSIQSPATQKLSAFRNKLLKKAKPQTLFQSTSSKNFESARGAQMFADIPKDNSKNVPNTDKTPEEGAGGAQDDDEQDERA